MRVLDFNVQNSDQQRFNNKAIEILRLVQHVNLVKFIGDFKNNYDHIILTEYFQGEISFPNLRAKVSETLSEKLAYKKYRISNFNF